MANDWLNDLEIQNISRRSLPRTTLEACDFDPRLGNRSVFFLDPRLFLFVGLPVCFLPSEMYEGESATTVWRSKKQNFGRLFKVNLEVCFSVKLK